MWERGLKQCYGTLLDGDYWSLPMWERGLKPKTLSQLARKRVAPHVGAWIETCQKGSSNLDGRSLPMWERGLKLPRSRFLLQFVRVAPHVGAWIETPLSSALALVSLVAPHVGAWIETYKVIGYMFVLKRRSPCGSVD